jgi:hypothetical protein
MKFDFDKNSNVLNERLIQTAADNINNNVENGAELTGKSFSGKLDMRQFTLDQMIDMTKTQLQRKGFVETEPKKQLKQFKTFPCYQFYNLTNLSIRGIDIYLGAGVTPKHHKKYILYLLDINLCPSTGWDGCSFGIYINGEQSLILLSAIQEWFGFYISKYEGSGRGSNPNFNEEETPWDNFNNLLLMVDILMKNIEPIKKLIEHEADRLYDNGYMPIDYGANNIAEQTSKNIGLFGTLEIILQENRISTTGIPGDLRKKFLPLL